MKLPLCIGTRLAAAEWREVKRRTIFEFCKWNLQHEDHCVLADFPLLLDADVYRTLAAAAERMAAEAEAAERELLGRPELHSRLGLPRAIRKALRKAMEPSSFARVMRFDFHFTDEGWKVSEVNADVPGGFIEASGFTKLMAGFTDSGIPSGDPAAAYVRALEGRLGNNATIGFVHATAYSDDREVMQHLANLAVRQGLRPVMTSPAHLSWRKGRASFVDSDVRTDGLVRFYPGEWLPTLPKTQWRPYFGQNTTPISNPATALLLQSKRFPLVWDELRNNLPTWRAFMPETRCTSDVPKNEPDDWVLKPVFGRVGEDIAIRGVTGEREMRLIARSVRFFPRRWAAQRRFHIVPVEAEHGTYFPCVGVFTIEAKTAGVYGRIGRKPLIDHDAQDIAVLLRADGAAA